VFASGVSFGYELPPSTSLPMSSRKFTCGQVKNKFGGVDILHISIVLSIHPCAF